MEGRGGCASAGGAVLHGGGLFDLRGAYSVLSYVADVAVNHYGWLTADQMVQGLGLKAVLIRVTAAVIGVIANLAVYFATQVLFPEGLSLQGLDLFALIVAVVSFIVLQRYKVPVYLKGPVGAVVGMVWTLP